MRDRILVPLDGSRLSEVVLPVVEALAREAAAQIVLLRSIGPDDVPGPEADVRQRTEAYLSGVATGLKARGPSDVRWTVWYGDPAQVVLNAAAREAVTLIAMGTHGRAGLPRLRFGSVAESVVRHAPVPVLLVRGELGQGIKRTTRLLVPLDGSARSEAILPAVERLAGPLHCPLDLLHVIEPPPPATLAETTIVAPLEELVARRRVEITPYLAELAARLAAKGLQATTAIREGPPIDVILRYTREAGCGLIAMSTHGRSGIGRLVLGSVAESILRATAVPILLWKAPDVRPSEPRRSLHDLETFGSRVHSR